MSVLSKVAAGVLFLDQKLHSLSARVHTLVSDKAYDSAEKTFNRNTAKAIAKEAAALRLAQARAEAIHRQHAEALRLNAERQIQELAKVEAEVDQAYIVRNKYEGVGAVCFAHASVKKERAQQLNELRAAL
jgi:hypothetical protein